jgi:methionine--tRNA ligase beta chain
MSDSDIKPTITIDEFAKVDIRIGTVTEVTIPKGSAKLLRCVVDFGQEIGTRVIFSGIKQFYEPDQLVGKQLPYIINLAPRKMMGEESQGMLMAGMAKIGDEYRAVLLVADSPVKPGTMVL